MVLAGLAAAYAFTAAGRYLESPSQSPHAADLIAVLGGDHSDRNRKAAELYKLGYASRVLLTGMEGAANPLNPRAQRIIKEGVLESALIFDGLSTNSWGEAVNTLELMRARGLKQVLVVSDPPHMRRIQWTWGKVFAGSGKNFRPIACHVEGWDASHWWRSRKFLKFVIREYAKLAYYRVVH